MSWDAGYDTDDGQKFDRILIQRMVSELGGVMEGGAVATALFRLVIFLTTLIII